MKLVWILTYHFNNHLLTPSVTLSRACFVLLQIQESCVSIKLILG